MPEKPLSQISRVFREQHEKGVAALQRNNLDYAISLLGVVVEKEPGCFESREALRAAQLRKAGGTTSFFRKMIGSANPMLAKGQLALRSHPLEALQIAENILNNDPYNSSAHKLLADAAMASDFPRTAALSLEIVLKNSPKDREVTLKYAKALAAAGQIEKAETLITELLRANPSDQDVAMALKNLSANRTMQEGGYEAAEEGKGSFRDMLRDKEEAVSLEQESRQVKEGDVADKLIREYEERLQREPANLKLLRSIAELLAQKKDFDRSLEFYAKASAAASGADASLERAIAETTSKKFDHALAQLDSNAADQAEQAVRIQAERQAYQIAECRNRVERYPNDLQIHFELGQLYFHAGKITEAIQAFQKAQANPHRRIQALGFLGQCFARRGMNDLAARTLQNAIKEKVGFDEERKELIYALGSVFEKMGKRDEAIEQFKLIYETDIGYKDVAAKVDAYYAGQ